jgi:hypothetical protein
MRSTVMGALALMACGLLIMLSTTCQAGGGYSPAVNQNPRVRASIDGRYASHSSFLLTHAL